MDYEVIKREFSLSSLELEELIAAMVAANGVPTNLDDCIALAELLLPPILEQRARLTARTGSMIVATTSLATADITGPRFLPLPFIVKDVAQCVGLAPGLHPVALEQLDLVTQALERVPIVPHTAPDNPEVIFRVTERLQGRAQRRALDAERETVRNTAEKKGKRYAWRLTGAETCSVCIARAANGAMYRSETTAKRFTHDNCDCYLELVEDVENWEGKAVADEISKLISSHSEMRGKTWVKSDWPAIRKEFEEMAPGLIGV